MLLKISFCHWLVSNPRPPLYQLSHNHSPFLKIYLHLLPLLLQDRVLHRHGHRHRAVQGEADWRDNPKVSFQVLQDLSQENTHLLYIIILNAVREHSLHKGKISSSGLCYKTFFWRKSTFPQNYEVEKSLFWCLNLHENVKTMLFSSKTIF